MDHIQHAGLLVYLLPYVEQDNIYRQLQVDLNPGNVGPAWYTIPTDWQLAQTPIKLFLCASDNLGDDTSLRGSAMSFHMYNSGATLIPDTDDNTWEDAVILDPSNPTVLGRSNYGGCAGLAGRGTSPYWSKYEGMFTNRSKASLARIPDGTSNTLMLGEFYGGRENGQREYLGSWMGVGTMPTWGGLPEDGKDFLRAEHFCSNHPGGVQFCFADGSVRLLRKGSSWIDWFNWALADLWPNNYPPDWWLVQELAGMRDGGTRDTSSVLD